MLRIHVAKHIVGGGNFLFFSRPFATSSLKNVKKQSPSSSPPSPVPKITPTIPPLKSKQPITSTESSTSKKETNKIITKNSIKDKPVIEKSTKDKPSDTKESRKSTTDKPTTDKPITDKHTHKVANKSTTKADKLGKETIHSTEKSLEKTTDKPIKSTNEDKSTNKPTTDQPATSPKPTNKITTNKTTSYKPTQDKSTNKLTTVKPKTDKPTDKPTTSKPTTDKPTTDKPTTDKPTTDKPTTNKLTTGKPTTDKSTTDKPTTDKPTTSKLTTDKFTTDKPPTGKPTTDKSTTPKTIQNYPPKSQPSQQESPQHSRPIQLGKKVDKKKFKAQKSKEQQLKEQQIKEQQTKEQQIKDQKLQERKLKELQHKERELKEIQLKEEKLRQAQLKEQQIKEEALKQQQEQQQQKEKQTLQHHTTWKALVQAFGDRNKLSFLGPLLEEAVSHRFATPVGLAGNKPHIVSDRLVALGMALVELQLTEYYLGILPRGAQLATRICMDRVQLHAVGQRMGLDKLLHQKLLSVEGYEASHPLSEAKRLETATGETVLALAAAIHLHHKAAKTDPTPLFTHRLIARPLTLAQLIKEHRPRQALDSFLRSRPRPAHLPRTAPWEAQTQPPSTTHSTFAIYRVMESMKGILTVGVYVDGKLLTTEYGSSVPEAEEMAAVRALEILRNNAAQNKEQEQEQTSE